MMRLSTAALMVGIGAPTSSAFWLVHLPVPFCAASSRMRSSTAPPLSGSRCAKMARRDLDQVGTQLARVPLREHIVQLVVRETQAAVQHVVGLGDQLHVAVLDAVVHHLHVVPGAERAHVRHAGHAIVGLRGHRPAESAPARHRPPAGRRASCSAPTAPPPRRRTHPCRRSESPSASSALQRRSVSRNQELPPSIRMSPGSRCGFRCATALSTAAPGRHHHEHPPRFLEHRHQCGRRLCTAYLLTSARPFDERACLGRIEVVANHRKPIPLRVEGEIATHDAEADDTELVIHVEPRGKRSRIYEWSNQLSSWRDPGRRQAGTTGKRRRARQSVERFAGAMDDERRPRPRALPSRPRGLWRDRDIPD